VQEAGILELQPAYCCCLLIYRGVTHPGRTLTARERGVPRGTSASRPDQILVQSPRSKVHGPNQGLSWLSGLWTRDFGLVPGL